MFTVPIYETFLFTLEEEKCRNRVCTANDETFEIWNLNSQYNRMIYRCGLLFNRNSDSVSNRFLLLFFFAFYACLPQFTTISNSNTKENPSKEATAGIRKLVYDVFFPSLFCSFIVMVQRMCRHARWARNKTATIYLNKLNMQKLHRYCVSFIHSFMCVCVLSFLQLFGCKSIRLWSSLYRFHYLLLLLL